MVRRWVRNSDRPGALVAEEMGLRKIFPEGVEAKQGKWVSEMVVMGLLLSIMW
jgi:hypothetical protein